MTPQGRALAPWETVRVLKLVTVAMIGGVILFLVVAVVMNEQDGPTLPQLNNYHTITLVSMMALAFICLLAGKMFMSRGILKAKNSLNPLTGKLNIYRSAFVLNLFALETPAWIALSLYLFTGSFPFLALAAVLLGLMIAAWPSAKKIAAQLELDWKDQDELVKK